MHQMVREATTPAGHEGKPHGMWTTPCEAWHCHCQGCRVQDPVLPSEQRLQSDPIGNLLASDDTSRGIVAHSVSNFPLAVDRVDFLIQLHFSYGAR